MIWLKIYSDSATCRKRAIVSYDIVSWDLSTYGNLRGNPSFTTANKSSWKGEEFKRWDSQSKCLLRLVIFNWSAESWGLTTWESWLSSRYVNMPCMVIKGLESCVAVIYSHKFDLKFAILVTYSWSQITAICSNLTR